MNKIVSSLLVIAVIVVMFSACSKEPTNTLELVESYYSNGYAVLVFQNHSGVTITNVEGGIVLWSRNNEQLKTSKFYWNSSCEPGDTFEVKLAMNVSGYVDRVGYSISSINNGEVPEFS